MKFGSYIIFFAQHGGDKPCLIEWDNELPVFNVLQQEAKKAEKIAGETVGTQHMLVETQYGVALVALFMLFPSAHTKNMLELIAAEVVKNHLKLKSLGGRYCSLQGITAAQLRIKQAGNLQALYQTQYFPDIFGPIPYLDKGETPLFVYAKGIKVRSSF